MSKHRQEDLKRQQGYSTIVMVMLLMLFGTLMLKGLNGQLTTQVRIYADERRYFRAYYQAVSSLSWGLAQPWIGLNANWQCRRSENIGLTSCAKQLSDSQVLLRGEGSGGAHPLPLTLFQLAEVKPGNITSLEIKLKPLPYGRIDFCPLKTAVECQP
ncbi:YgdB family protein [Pragia fontium]|uniref:DUF2509 domain-containing protein n=2 Tax=Pragia fontium TaxID=82985 RepID=A0AAJ4WA14_9GAMM|nr:YgdB family protein [Pragia fontium]GKX63536.1 hypothetical protein SOASR032_21050 [Pragia fontium]SFC67702.1 Protein of unknown function [Pragia fontium DSM 5563 = ATCC 49100]